MLARTQMSSWLSPMLWSGPLAATVPLSEVGPDQFFCQLDHRRHVAEADLFPPGVSRGGTQPGGSADALGNSGFRPA